MSIELKQAAQDAAEAIDWLLKNIRLDTPQLSGKSMGNAEKCASALRSALAQQPATGEPVAWMHPSGGVLQALLAGIERNTYTIPLYTHPAPSVPATPEPVMDVRCEGCGYMTHHREHMGCVRAAKQHTHPAPSVPGDMVRDAERYRWLAGYCLSTSEHWGGRWSIIIDGPAPKTHDSEDDLDEAIDAAMLAAKDSK